jgi:hypothetical protein
MSQKMNISKDLPDVNQKQKIAGYGPVTAISGSPSPKPQLSSRCDQQGAAALDGLKMGIAILKSL